MARVARSILFVLWFVVVALWFDHDPAGLLTVGAALLVAGPVIRLAVRGGTLRDVEPPAGPSRFATVTAMSCLSVVKAGLAEGLLPRRTDRLTDRS